jgi:hypothetical protein
MAIELRWLPPNRYRRSSVSGTIWHSEVFGRVLLLVLLYMLLACACRPASNRLNTLSLTGPFTGPLTCGEVRAGLGLTMLPTNAPTVTCTCGSTLPCTDVDHRTRCPFLVAQAMLRHEILEGILCHIVHRVDIASSLEPAFCRLPGLNDGAGTSGDIRSIRVTACRDILLVLPEGIAISDMSVLHVLSLNTLPAAAVTAGAAAACRDQQKRAASARVEPAAIP